MKKKKGRVFVISGPSGAGKSTLINSVLEELEGFVRSVSVTTRPRRDGGYDKYKYRFISDEQFEEMIKNEELLEYAKFSNYYYGTPKEFVFAMLEQGMNVILEIEVQGAMQVKSKIKNAYMIFVITSDSESLKNRLIKRNTESDEEIQQRLDIAREELKYQKYYDCIIVNNDYNEALLNLKYVLTRQKESR
jgi:guanylate kinase